MTSHDVHCDVPSGQVDRVDLCRRLVDPERAASVGTHLHRGSLTFFDRNVTLHANVPGLIERLLVNHCAASVRVDEPVHLCVLLTADNLLLDTLLREFAAITPKARARTCICTSESGTYYVDHFPVMSGVDVYRCVKTRCLMLADHATATYRFVLPGDYASSGNPGDDLEPMVEHLLHKVLTNAGCTLLHASVVALNGQGIAFVGPKRSGKTTCFFDACLQLGATPVTVDKAYIRVRRGQVLAHHVGSSLRVLSGTLNKYADKFSGYMPKEYVDATPELHWAGHSRAKAKVPIGDFEAICGRRFVSSVPLKTVVFPSISSRHRPGTAHRIALDTAVELMTAQDFTARNPEEDDWSGLASPSSRESSSRVRTICSQVDAWVVQASEDSAELLAQLMAI